MRNKLVVTLEENWLAQRKADRVKPMNALVHYLNRISSVQVLDDNEHRCEILYEDTLIMEAALIEKIYSYMKKRYPDLEPGAITVSAPDPVPEEPAENNEKDISIRDLFDDVDIPEMEPEEKPDPMEKIRALVGAEEFKALAEECVRVAPSLLKHDIVDTFLCRSYLFAINDGEGLTTYLELFADLLAHLKLIQFRDTRRISEIVLAAPGSEKNNDGISNACSTIRRFNSGGRIICIDISACMTHIHEPRFRVLLECINESAAKDIVVFRVPFVEKNVLHGIKKGLADILSVREVSMVPFDTQELLQCAAETLERRGFSMSEDAWEILRARIVEEKGDGRFYGINTINKIIREMIYMKQLNNAAAGVDDQLIKKSEILELSDTYDREEKSGFDMLDEFIGMGKIKTRIEEIVLQIEMAMKNPGLGSPCIHMRFVGNPGTGKTTVARVLGKILKERGILRKGSFFEHAGRDFCGRFVGETAPKTAAMCRDAYGSVLFIDEAYTLYRSGASSVDYGREAIDTLIAEMENHRTDLVVIMAGYTDEMETLMQANPGLESRMPYVIEFPNYTREELCEIFMSMAVKNFPCAEGLRTVVAEYFNRLPDELLNSKEFSNARFVRNLFERTWGKAGLRKQLNHEPEIVLLPEDFTAASKEKEFNRLMTKKTRTLGFV